MSCCDACIKYLLVVFNIFFALGGLALVSVGGILLSNSSYFAELIHGPHSSLKMPQIFVIILGVFIFFVASLGCCGAVRENRCMLITYAIILFCIFVIQLAIGIYSLTHKDHFKAQIKKGLKAEYVKIYDNPKVKELFESVEHNMECCGVYGFHDYHIFPTGRKSVPKSCCADKVYCKAKPIYWNNGCLKVLSDFTDEAGESIGGVAIALSIVEESNGKMEARNFENSTLAFLTEDSTLSPRVNLREKIKIEFYKTYDVMTGIRIAATLGGFFSMMILLVLYKNYCKPNKTLSEEQLNAAVTAAAEEEDRALQAALEATSFYTALEKRRESVRNTNQVLLPPRFSSVGGGYSHLAPPLKAMQQRGKSLPGSVMQFSSTGAASSFLKNEKSDGHSKEEDADFYNQQLDYFACRNYLNVPPSRRVSSVTCSSADSAYLERRCSAFELGLPSPSRLVGQSREKLQEKTDFYYPIDIQVIQPTPEMSPTASERNLNEEQTSCSLQVPAFNEQMHRLSVTSFDMGLAPLASISTLSSFSSQSLSLAEKSLEAAGNIPTENQVCSCADDSLGSDSVFMDVEDKDFATDSEFEYDGFDDDYSFCETKQRLAGRPEKRTLQFASFDSFDASITSNSENLEEETPKAPTQEEKHSFQCPGPQASDLKRHLSLHDGNKIRKKLVKTYSEPRSSKVKRLPTWTEKGRSGYVPKRQLSSPSARKKKFVEDGDPTQRAKKSGKEKTSGETTPIAIAANTKTSQDDENAKDLAKFLFPPSSISSSNDSVTLTPNTQISEELSTSSPKQGINKEMPLKNTQKLSLLNAQEKRSRLQKQKNFIEETNETFAMKEKTEERREGSSAGSPREPRARVPGREEGEASENAKSFEEAHKRFVDIQYNEGDNPAGE